MPDLSIENHTYCVEARNKLHKLPNSKNTHYYQVFYNGRKWECDCPSYKYRKTCKHIDQVVSKACNWHTESTGYKVCPECGGEVQVVRVGV
jgi:hypothetical protein